MEEAKDKTNLFELVEAHANLVRDGISAYSAGDHAAAIELLTLVLDQDKNDWNARWYLGLSYHKARQFHTAAGCFRYLKLHCDDAEFRGSAEAALAALDGDLKSTRRLNPYASAHAPLQQEQELDLDWIKNRSE